MSDQVVMAVLPRCDFCRQNGQETTASYDFKTRQGPWAYGCERHWKQYRAENRLGTGIGQRLVLVKGEG